VLALHRRKGREEAGEFLVEGVRGCEDLVAPGVVPRLALISPSPEDSARGRALAARVRALATVVDVTDGELARVADTETPQGIAMIAAIPRVELAGAAVTSAGLVIVLDAVQDPGNFGTIVRSADAFGAELIVTLPGTVDPWNPKAVRSAAGSSLRLPIAAADLPSLRSWLTERGGVLLGADAAGDRVDAAPVGDGPVALALGNEGAGLSEDVRAACARLVAVPIAGSAESLNVGVAAGILMYLLSRRA
jgi:TrmH family RNA methyltransferase